MILDEMKPFFSLILQSMKVCSVFSCLGITQRALAEQLVIENRHMRFTLVLYFKISSVFVTINL